MNILHVTCVRELSSGQRKQLAYECDAATQLDGVIWEVVALTCTSPKSSFEKQVPRFFRPIFLRNIYAWIYMMSRRKCHDFILSRHMVCDLSSIIFARFLTNRISIHHSKEPEELILVKNGLKGKVASFLERHVGGYSVRSARGVAGVTDEIRRYEVFRNKIPKKSYVYPNGINLSSITMLPDEREDWCVNAAFVCGKFSSWHGLERLFDDLKQSQCQAKKIKLKIHLIGRLLESQEELLKNNPALLEVFVIHGELAFSEYFEILQVCDIGLSSFALDEKGLQEASTLKVREYLALGLPVYSGHLDSFGDNFFYHQGTASLSSIYEFGCASKAYKREAIRSESANMVDKAQIMKRLIASLDSEVLRNT